MRALLRRLWFYLVAAFAAITLNFFIPRMVPGSALQNFLAKMNTASLTPSQLQALEAQYGGGHQGLVAQYLTYLGNLFHGNLGMSTSLSTPVSTVLGNDLPWTIGLVGSATVIAFLVGTLIGVLAGWRRSGLLDSLLPAATFFQAVPYFILASLLMLTLGFYGGMFPTGGAYDTGRFATVTPGWNGPFIANVIDHAALPAATVALASIAGWIIGMRNMMITTMDEDYVLVAAAKGLPRWRVVGVAARNALLPSISNFALSISLVVTGSIVTEIVFNYAGVGREIFNAAQAADYPVMQGILLVVTFTVLGANLLADIVYVALDPRARKVA
ncbi:ABC transporter permease [Streptacidiphilus jiangxiensis]|uniref:Peptide/nickel transport system permease protein n=1 Tax=Streptacidiphilus jiangxiensis TaxID=235985 RepID=A0A1H7ZX09_STRJI|nr:ABC transporter permease [Streptacidiphilus jiangxiensis]SEM61837.1 peptide/nickel transport system permease protein [Streptacidiphilus jiangxiensis]